MSVAIDTSNNIDDDFADPTNGGQSKKQRVIIPPPEIKAVVDKTAAYVAKNGYSFEALIMKVEANNPKFNFLRHMDDPYRPYYMQKLNEGMGKTEEKEAEAEVIPQETGDQVQEDQIMDNSAVQAQIIHQKPKENEYQKQLRQMIFGDFEEKRDQLRPPPGDQFNISHPVLANIDMDVIKLTAQFVARNGQKFLQGLSEREQRNPQFDFLKPTHGLFGYFTQLVESYSKVLIPRNEQLQRLSKFAEEPMEILKSSGQRYLWEKMQDEEQRRKVDQGADTGMVATEEQMQVDTIDWHDFVVVEKIDLYDDEEMRMLDEQELQSQKEQEKIKEQIRQQIEENQQLLNMPQQLPEGKKETANEVVISTALDPEMKIKKNYQRKTEEKKTTGTQKCPKCQQEIPITEWKEHMRLELMDPKWREEKMKREERAKLNSLASGDEITKNIRKFAEERKDIFPSMGPETQQVQQQSQIQQPSQAGRIIWDGQAENITTTANIAMLHHQTQKNLQEALSTRGNLDPKSLEKLNQQQSLPQNVKNIQSQILQKDLGGKGPVQGSQQSKLDEDESLNLLQGQLRSESEWIRLFPGKITVHVQTPQTDQTNAQTITILVDSRITVQQLKDNLSQKLGGIPGSKIRLRNIQNYALKDNFTLAFFNISDGAILQLTLKDNKK